MHKIYIDGSVGTTGLQIVERLQGRRDLQLLEIEESKRKDFGARLSMISQADVAILCLPDEASREIAAAADKAGIETVIIDASSAHRTSEGWVYGMPELSPQQREAIRTAKRITNPGCHASGFIAVVAPLVKAGILSADFPAVCLSVTGYSGGGKAMIAEYEAADRPVEFSSPRQYALKQGHKHLPEMTKWSGLNSPPVFCPVIGDFEKGMIVSVPLHANQLNGSYTRADIHKILVEHYVGRDDLGTPSNSYIHILPLDSDDIIAANALAGRDDMLISVDGNDERIVLNARFDNLGKGASGAAVQCLGIVMGGECETRNAK